MKKKPETEKNIQTTIAIDFCKGNNNRLFRNNVGMGYSGKAINRTPTTITLEYPSPVKFGLCVGSGDLIGWTQVEITPDMVGKTIAQFTSVEVKTKNGRASDEQTNFMNFVNNAGGRALLVRDPDYFK